MHKEKIRIALGLADDTQVEEIVRLIEPMYDVEVVDDSEQAYHTIHVFKPDVAVLDYSLAKIHPIELYEGVALAHAHVNFVICVTEENYQIAQRVWKRRSSDFVFKPFYPLQFVSELSKIVRNILNEREIVALRKKLALLDEGIKRLKEQR